MYKPFHTLKQEASCALCGETTNPKMPLTLNTCGSQSFAIPDIRGMA